MLVPLHSEDAYEECEVRWNLAVCSLIPYENIRCQLRGSKEMTLPHSFKQGGERYAGSFHSTLKICLRAPGKQKGVTENMEESGLSRVLI